MPPDESWLNDPSGRDRKLMRTLGRWPAVNLSVSPLALFLGGEPRVADQTARGGAVFRLFVCILSPLRRSGGVLQSNRTHANGRLPKWPMDRHRCGQPPALRKGRGPGPATPSPRPTPGWVLVVRATLARSEAKSRGRRRAVSRVRLPRLSQACPNSNKWRESLEFGCVARLTSPMPGASCDRDRQASALSLSISTSHWGASRNWGWGPKQYDRSGRCRLGNCGRGGFFSWFKRDRRPDAECRG